MKAISKTVIKDPVFAAELTMTFLQLAHDEWTMLCNDPYVKGRAVWERAEVGSHILTLSRQIKNAMIARAGENGRLAFRQLQEVMADNADSAEAEIAAARNEIRSLIIQKMPWDVQGVFTHIACTYALLRYANETQKMMGGDRCDSPHIKAAFDLVNDMCQTLRLDIWEDPGQLEVGSVFGKLVNKVIAAADRNNRKDAGGNPEPNHDRKREMRGGSLSRSLDEIARNAGLRPLVPELKIHIERKYERI